MTLATTEWGSGRSAVLLLHGMLGSSQSWWRVAPAVAARGHRVIALDLPGHGSSPAEPEASVPRIVDLIVETWQSTADGPPALAIGHSYGGTALAAAADRLTPARSVFVDSPFTKRGGWDAEVVRREYAGSKASRTAEGLRARRPFYSERDIEAEARAAEQFDVETAVALAGSPGGDWTDNVQPDSLMVRAAPSDYITDEIAADLEHRGVHVRSILGAAHSVWYSHFDEFMAAIDDQY